MNKRRRFKVKRRRRAQVIAWQACRVIEGILRHQGFHDVRIRPTQHAIRGILER